MCGICGVVGSLRPDDSKLVAAMSARLAHRGPDADGLWASAGIDDGPAGGGVVLGHRRLAIIDLQSASDQPMVDPATGNVVVFNGEIYNYRDLAAELRAMGVEFRTRSDTEVLLKAYAAWGEACVDRFRGMFAFALWDASERELFLARDHVGVKPLYFTADDSPDGARRTLFASEVRALLAGLPGPARLDPRALRTYLWHGFVADEHAIVAGVRLLPPGSTLTLSADGRELRRRTYWELPRAPAARGTDVAPVAAALEEAVGLRLISDAPLGVFLSGGVDSSAVAALAARHAGDGLQTFNLSFEEQAFDESRYAEEIARRIGSRHRRIVLRQADFLGQLDDALSSIDQPTFDAINSYFISRAVREAGVTVALAGTGGDEIFGGYRSFREIPHLAKRLSRGVLSPRILRRLGAWGLERALATVAGAVPPQTRWGKVPDLLRGADGVLDIYQYSYALFTERLQTDLLANDAGDDARTVRGLPPSLHAARSERLRDQPLAHAVSLCELESFIRDRLLRDTDAASMAVALEARVPLLDYRIIETTAALDDATRFHPFGRKRLLQELALDEPCRAIMDRPKSGFVLPIEVWCREALRDRVRSTLTDRDLCLACGLSPDVVAAVWTAFDSGARGMYWSRIWSLFVLLQWCRRHEVFAAT